MADKVSTLVLKVDLECAKCYNKVRKTLCQEHYNIRSQAIDVKTSTITITGPFDPVEFAKKLKSKAGKAIKNIDIVKKKEEEKPKPKEADKPAEKPKAKEADKPAEKPKPKEAEKPKAKEADKPKEDKPKEAEKPKQAEKPKEDKPKEDKAAEKPKEDKGAEKSKKVTFDEPKAAASTPGPGMKFVEPGTVLAYPMVHPYGGYTVPCYEGYVQGGPAYDTGYYGRPVGYEHGYGTPVNTGYYGNNHNNGYSNNRINNNNNYGSDSYFSERDPSCTIM